MLSTWMLGKPLKHSTCRPFKKPSPRAVQRKAASQNHNWLWQEVKNDGQVILCRWAACYAVLLRSGLHTLLMKVDIDAWIKSKNHNLAVYGQNQI